MKEDSPPQTQRTHIADDVLRTRRLRREDIFCSAHPPCAKRIIGHPVVLCVCGGEMSLQFRTLLCKLL